MTESRQIYDQQAAAYAEFADQRYAWNYLERPAFDKYIPDLYRPETRILDIGCGTGTVARYLISRGVLPQNIIGIDISHALLEQARAATPGVSFIEASAAEFDLPAESIDLVTMNTVLHHLDNEQLERVMDKVYEVLAPDGFYFFVEVDPDHSAEGRDPRNTNKWTMVKTPWGTEVPFFNKDPYDLVFMLDRHGFDKVSGWLLKVAPEGMADPENYVRYSSGPSRMAARYRKVPELTKILRSNDIRIPILPEPHDQRIQGELVKRYFDAWRTQSIETVTEIFAENAIYDEKPGKEEPLQGIESIQNYWRANPLSHQNLRVDHTVVGFSAGNSVWVEFKGNFDVRGEHVSIKGVIKFTIDLSTKKITRLTEYFTTEKVPIV